VSALIGRKEAAGAISLEIAAKFPPGTKPRTRQVCALPHTTPQGKLRHHKTNSTEKGDYKMNDERSEQASTTHQVEVTSQCGPGCNCGTTGLRTKGKVIVCLVVAIAAAVVLARGLVRKAESKSIQGQNAFAATAPAISPEAPSTTEKVKTTDTIRTKSSLWGEPLKNLASLNEVAAQKDGVFVYLPAKGRGPDETVKLQVEKAASEAQSGGKMIALYTLDDHSLDYAQVTSKIPAPCILAMVKGGGVRAVTNDISEGKLLQALVEASRPSGCGPSGCGPSGCK
jgi:hypothetical protein